MDFDIINKKIEELKDENIQAIGLMGSYARGEGKKYSDVDIVCFLKSHAEGKESIIEMIDEKYFVTSYVHPNDVDEYFTCPEKATEYIQGLKKVKVLWEQNNYLRRLKERADNFHWNDTLQKQANEYASKQLVGWVEEVHKALQGLISNDNGRMLNGIFGLTYGLFNVIRVQKGIMLEGDNSFYDKVVGYYPPESKFKKLSATAFGLKGSTTFKERVVAGLLLFDEVTDDLIDILENENRDIIITVKKSIKNELFQIRDITSS